MVLFVLVLFLVAGVDYVSMDDVLGLTGAALDPISLGCCVLFFWGVFLF